MSKWKPPQSLPTTSSGVSAQDRSSSASTMTSARPTASPCSTPSTRFSCLSLGAAPEEIFVAHSKLNHPQCPQILQVHRRHADPAGGRPGRSQQSDELQQPAVRAAQDYSFGHQDGRAPLPQYPRPCRRWSTR